MFKNTLSAFVLVVCVLSLTAQREITRVVTATGSYVASAYETPAYGQSQALLAAKKQALREAGVAESVSSTAIFVTGGDSDNFREINSELGRIELEGRVRVQAQSDLPPVFTNDNLVRYSTTIRAEVVVEETEEDLNFQLEVDGFNNTYLSGEKMIFTVKPTSDCYLRVFLFGPQDKSSVQIYPVNGIFKDVKLKAGQTILFPPEQRDFLYDIPFEYTMELNDKNSNIEQDVVLIVALKKPYPFVGDVNYENVIRWLSRIKRNERCVWWQGVNIFKNL